MSLFKLSNQIFQLGLDAQEVSVYAYLCSLPTAQHTITGSDCPCEAVYNRSELRHTIFADSSKDHFALAEQGAYRAAGTFCKSQPA